MNPTSLQLARITAIAASTSMVIGAPTLSAPGHTNRTQSDAASPPQVPIHPSSLLLVDPTPPKVTISWTRANESLAEYAGVRPYTVDAERTLLGGNISCYAAVGGTRLTKGAGHRRGSIVRVGFYKADNAKPFFDGVAADTEITVTMTGVRFNQPADPNPGSLIQHLKYDPGDLQACGLPGDAREQFNTADPRDTLNDRVRPGIDTRLGVFAPGTGKLGTSSIVKHEDGTITMTLTFRYPALRNLRDPWKSDLPGTFLEPYHFHIEFEVLPEGVAPLDPARDRVVPIDGASNE